MTQPASCGQTGAGKGRGQPRFWPRIGIGLAACPLVLLLAGCEIAGTIDVRSGNEVVADLTFTEAAVDCLGLTKFAGLTIKGTPDPGGNQRCRAQGTVDLEELKQFGIQVTQLGEYLTVDLAMPRSVGDTPMQVDIRFPGPVTDSGATVVSGNQVRLTSGTGIATTSPTRIVAMTHAGPEWWIDAAAAGFVGGVGITLAGLWLLRRRVRAQASAAIADGSDADGQGSPPGPGDPPTGPPAGAPEGPPTADATAPERVSGPEYEAQFAPPTTAGGANAAPARTPPPASVPGAPAADHSIWGPPEDPGDR